MAYAHQDWEPVVVRKPSAAAVQAAKAGQSRVSQLAPAHTRALDDNPETFANRTFDKDYIQAVIQKRTERKWNQKQLATQLNVDAAVVQRFEQGKEVYNPGLKNKLNRVLGIKKANDIPFCP